MKNRKLIKLSVVILIAILMMSYIASMSCVYGASTDDAISAMTSMSEDSLTDSSNGKLGRMLNSVIGLIQVAGTGISMIMVTIFGIKYIMAAPSDKADVKKQIAPMMIGALVLFGSVNLVNMIVKAGVGALKDAAG